MIASADKWSSKSAGVHMYNTTKRQIFINEIITARRGKYKLHSLAKHNAAVALVKVTDLCAQIYFILFYSYLTLSVCLPQLIPFRFISLQFITSNWTHGFAALSYLHIKCLSAHSLRIRTRSAMCVYLFVSAYFWFATIEFLKSQQEN